MALRKSKQCLVLKLSKQRFRSKQWSSTSASKSSKSASTPSSSASINIDIQSIQVLLMCSAHNAADHSELRLRNKFSRLRPNPDGALFAFDHMALQSEQLAQSVKCYLKFRLLAYMSGKRFRLSSYTVINEIPTNI